MRIVIHHRDRRIESKQNPESTRDIADTLENCIKKQCNRLPIAIDIYLCLILLRNIEK